MDGCFKRTSEWMDKWMNEWVHEKLHLQEDLRWNYTWYKNCSYEIHKHTLYINKI